MDERGIALMERPDETSDSLTAPAPFGLDLPSMSPDELARLSLEYAQSRDPNLRHELIMHHQRLVRSIASRFQGAGELLDDLIQVGNIGLINALDRFDPIQGNRFSTYATPTIIGEIKRYFRDKTAGIKIPRWLQELNVTTRRMAVTLAAELGRTPTISEIAERLNISEEDILEALESSEVAHLLSIETHMDGSSLFDSISLLDLIGCDDANMKEFENFTDLRRAISTLDANEREVIALRFFDELSQAKIAQQMQVSQMHVSRLQQRALKRLRTILSEESRLQRVRRLLQ